MHLSIKDTIVVVVVACRFLIILQFMPYLSSVPSIFLQKNLCKGSW